MNDSNYCELATYVSLNQACARVRADKLEVRCSAEEEDP